MSCLHNYGASLTIEDSTLTGCQANYQLGESYAGGAVYTIGDALEFARRLLAKAATLRESPGTGRVIPERKPRAPLDPAHRFQDLLLATSSTSRWASAWSLRLRPGIAERCAEARTGPLPGNELHFAGVDFRDAALDFGGPRLFDVGVFPGV